MYTHPGSGELLIYAFGLIIPGGEKLQLPPDIVIQEGIAKNMTRLWEESKNVVFIVDYELYKLVTGEKQQKWFAYLLVVPPPCHCVSFCRIPIYWITVYQDDILAFFL